MWVQPPRVRDEFGDFVTPVMERADFSPEFRSGHYAYDVYLANGYVEFQARFRTRSKDAAVVTATATFVPVVKPGITDHLNLAGAGDDAVYSAATWTPPGHHLDAAWTPGAPRRPSVDPVDAVDAAFVVLVLVVWSPDAADG